nr:hypothetical protein [Micromonospora sp. DSM 115978]
MTEWILGVCALIIAVGGAAAVLRRAVAWVIRTVRKWARLADDLLGEPARPGHAAVPGLMERVASMDDRLGEVERLVGRELRPNGGSSIKDQMTRVADAVTPDSAD